MLAPDLAARIEQPNDFAGFGVGGLNLRALEFIAPAADEPEIIFI